MVKRKLKLSIDSKQMILDLGQKYYGPIHCKTCDFVYIANSKEDEEMHKQQHNKLQKPIYFMVWQSARIIHEYSDGRIFLILPTDHIKNKERMCQIRKIVDKDLGTNGLKSSIDYSKNFMGENEKIFLFISGRYFAGFCSAQDITTAYKVKKAQTTDCFDTAKSQGKDKMENENVFRHTVQSLHSSLLQCEPHPVNIHCGVNQIWVAPPYKRRHIASRLIDSVRSNFHYGCALTKQEIAFTTPTIEGMQFIKSYYGQDDFYIYCSNK